MATSPDVFIDPNYTKHINQVNLVNEVYDGTDSCLKHIHKFGAENDKVYQARLREASLDSYVFKTVETTKNIIFRKPIDTSNITDTMLLDWLKKADLQKNINEFGKDLTINTIKDGFTYLLVDSENTDKEIINDAQRMEEQIRPYFVNIKRSQVKWIDRDEKGNIIGFPITETYKVRATDGFGWEYKEQTRLFQLIDGVVEWSLWRDGEEIANDILDIPAIPVVQIDDKDIPPLYDQARINIQHFNRNSEKANYVRTAGSPFLKFWGDEKSVPTVLGVGDGVSFGQVNTDIKADAEWCELEGTNDEIIMKQIKYNEEQMERISVDFATQVSNVTATEVEKASTANESKIMDYSMKIEEGLNAGIQMMGYYYDKITEDDTIATNKDFDSNIMTPEQQARYNEMRRNGDISWDEWRLAMEKGEVLRVLTDEERNTEKTRVRDEGISDT